MFCILFTIYKPTKMTCRYINRNHGNVATNSFRNKTVVLHVLQIAPMVFIAINILTVLPTLNYNILCAS